MKREAAIISDIYTPLKNAKLSTTVMDMHRSKEYAADINDAVNVVTKFVSAEMGTIQKIEMTFQLLVRGQSDNYSFIIGRYHDLLQSISGLEATLAAKYKYLTINTLDGEFEPQFTYDDKEKAEMEFTIEIKHAANEKWTVDNTDY